VVETDLQAAKGRSNILADPRVPDIAKGKEERRAKTRIQRRQW